MLILINKFLRFFVSIVILTLAPDLDSSASTSNNPLASIFIRTDISNTCEAKFDVKPVRLNSPMNV